MPVSKARVRARFLYSSVVLTRARARLSVAARITRRCSTTSSQSDSSRTPARWRRRWRQQPTAEAAAAAFPPLSWTHSLSLFLSPFLSLTERRDARSLAHSSRPLAWLFFSVLFPLSHLLSIIRRFSYSLDLLLPHPLLLSFSLSLLLTVEKLYLYPVE